MQSDFACGSAENQASMFDEVFAAAGQATRQHMQSGLQLQQVEWFDQIIVGAAQQPRDPMAESITRGQYQNGQLLALIAPPTQQRNTVLVRQSKIENAHIEMGRFQSRVGQTGAIDVINRQSM